MKLIIFLTLFLSSNVFAQVWESKAQWNSHHEKKFQKWIKKARNDIVINKKSPYYGLGVDCADLIYLLKIQYSKENKLNYSLYHPKTKSYISNEMDRFNYLPKSKRLKKFVQYIFNITSTSSLRDFNSYPIKISEIKPGDIFHYEKKKKDSIVRHVVIIQEVLDNGNFSYMYSTQATKENNIRYFKNLQNTARPFSKKENMSFYNIPDEFSGGFRRLIFPHNIDKDKKTLPDFSLEQFNLGKNFAQKVQKTLAKKEDTLFDKSKHKAKNLCKALKERQDIVNEGFVFYKEKQSCLSYREFDTFSTPMRDSEIKQEIQEEFVRGQKSK